MFLFCFRPLAVSPYWSEEGREEQRRKRERKGGRQGERERH
jgi:hypothetical protein